MCYIKIQLEWRTTINVCVSVRKYPFGFEKKKTKTANIVSFSFTLFPSPFNDDPTQWCFFLAHTQPRSHAMSAQITYKNKQPITYYYDSSKAQSMWKCACITVLLSAVNEVRFVFILAWTKKFKIHSFVTRKHIWNSRGEKKWKKQWTIINEIAMPYHIIKYMQCIMYRVCVCMMWFCFSRAHFYIRMRRWLWCWWFPFDLFVITFYGVCICVSPLFILSLFS